MDNQLALTAQRIKELRRIIGKTPEEMAIITGVSVEDYVRCENGESDFSFTFLHKCAKTFGVDIADLLTGENAKLSAFAIVRKGEGFPIARRKGFKYNHLAANFKSRLSEPFWVRAPYDAEAQNKPIPLASHAGEEFDYILKGSLKVQIGDHVDYLYEGDSVFYDSLTPHGMIAAGDGDCEFVAIVMDPAGHAQEYNAHEGLTGEVSRRSVEAQDDQIWRDFIDVTEDENGALKEINFKHKDNFNFAFDVVDELAKRHPGKRAMLHLDSEKHERTFTFKEMSELSSQAANYLSSLGVKKGDRVMLVLKRNYHFWFCMLALHKIGAIAIPATHLLVKKDYEYRFKTAGVSAIICSADCDGPHQADLTAETCPELKIKVVADGEYPGWHFLDGEMKAFPTVFPRENNDSKAEDIMLMFFSSGTTGYPKIAAHKFTYPLAHFVTAHYWHNVNPDGLHFTIADTGWGKALWGKFYGQWLCEAGVFTYDFEKFKADDILPLFKRYNITTFCAPPTMYRFFIKEDLKKYDLSSLQYATVAGEALNPEVFDRFYDATGLKIMEGFGQTETTLTVANLIGMVPKPGSMGKPTPQYDVDIVLPDGKPTKVGEIREIVIRTDRRVPVGLFREYYRDAEKTAEAWHDGVYHTGDTAWRDEDGYYWYVGRIDDLIKSSGYRIGPFEIESVIMELPYVLECAVTAVPDEIRGQVVKATIVLTKGTAGSDELKKEVQNYVKTHTAPYKYPRIVEFVDELPKTISGKIRRVDIRTEDAK